MFRSAQEDATTGPVPLKMASRRDETNIFFQKLAFGLDETPVTKIGGECRGPTPGPRNLNENPAPEELSGTKTTPKHWACSAHLKSTDLPTRYPAHKHAALE